MNADIARALYRRRLETLGEQERELAIRAIHDSLARLQREKIEHVYAEYRRQHGSVPVIVIVDVLYDEFGEKLGMSTHVSEIIAAIQQKALAAQGFAPVIFAFSPEDARNLLRRRFSAKDADAALRPPPPGNVKLFVCSMDSLSGYDAAVSSV